MKNLIILTSLLVSTSAYAICDRASSYGRGFSPNECATTAAGTIGAVGAGIYSAKKFGAADLHETKNTSLLFKSEPRIVSLSELSKNLLSVEDGDKITVSYQLSEVENRQYHIELMESNASSARASAAMHTTLSLTATRTETTTIGKTTTTRVVPDYAARAMHAALAITEMNNAREFDNKAEDARRGGPVPTYDFHEVIDKKVQNRQNVDGFVQERYAHESKITRVQRLPFAEYKIVKSLSLKAKLGLAAAVGAGAFAVEEIMAGKAARALDQRGFDIRDLRDDGNY